MKRQDEQELGIDMFISVADKKPPEQRQAVIIQAF